VAAARPIEVIEGPLMAGMNEVGDLFGAGKDVPAPGGQRAPASLKKAVAHLVPYLEAEKAALGDVRPRGKILMATVKGDVHDIGKNMWRGPAVQQLRGGGPGRHGAAGEYWTRAPGPEGGRDRLDRASSRHRSREMAHVAGRAGA